MLRIKSYRNSYPSQLSGGERQRLAIARAVATQPRLLLLDEPLLNLDLQLKTAIMRQLLKLNKGMGIAIIYVTHDQIEALIMGEKIILMNKGKIEQIAPPYKLLSQPKSEFVKNFMKFESGDIERIKEKLFI